MLRPGFPRLSHPGVAHAIPSIAFIAQGYRGRARRFLHDLGGKADRSTATGASTDHTVPLFRPVHSRSPASSRPAATDHPVLPSGLPLCSPIPSIACIAQVYLGGTRGFSPKISEVKATDQQRPAQAPTRAPRGARPYRRSRLVVLPVSSRHTRWATSQVGAAACHATRAAATSGRSCSDGRTVFFNGQAEGPHGAPDRRHTRGRGEGVLPLSQRAIRVRRHQRGQGV